MSFSGTLWAGNNTLLLEVNGVTNEQSDTVINDATVEVTITNMAGTEITGETWPVTATSTGSDGNYYAVIDAASSIEAGSRYNVTLVITSGTNTAESSSILVAQSRSLND